MEGAFTNAGTGTFQQMERDDGEMLNIFACFVTSGTQIRGLVAQKV